jgi:hypothetical protein
MAPFSRLRIRVLEDKNFSRKAGASLVGAEIALFALVLYVDHLTSNFSWWLLAARMVGLVATLLWDRAVALLLCFLFLGWLLFAIEDDIPDVAVYFVPTYLVLSLWMAVGFGFALVQHGQGDGFPLRADSAGGVITTPARGGLLMSREHQGGFWSSS